MELITELNLFIAEKYSYESGSENVAVLIDPTQNAVLIQTAFFNTILPFNSCHLDYRTLEYRSDEGVFISTFLPIACAMELNELKAKYIIKKDKRRFKM